MSHSSQTDHARGLPVRLMNRLHARLGGRRMPLQGFAVQPEPRTIGSAVRGGYLLAGTVMFAGHLIDLTKTGGGLWDPPMPPVFAREAHGFRWLGDLAALAGDAANARVQDWTFGWISRFGRGSGPGWEPDLTGRRVIRLICHAEQLLAGQAPKPTAAYFATLARHTTFLNQRWQAARPGLPRIEALTGLAIVRLSLSGVTEPIEPVLSALATELSRHVDAEGAVPSRDPEELLEIFMLLVWTASVLIETGHMVPRDVQDTIERIAPTLRALRHADGGLARFQGGDSGTEGWLDQGLAASGVRAPARSGFGMGYARLSAGRVSVIMDAKAPASGQHSVDAHASSLAFEMTVGRRPLVVSCGSGAPFGAEWRQAGRITASHSTLVIEGYSSSKFAKPGRGGDAAPRPLVEVPRLVSVRQTTGVNGVGLISRHDGYLPSHGLTHVRHLDLAFDGRRLMGKDTLGATLDADRRLFNRVTSRAPLEGVRFSIRFHLHPDVRALDDAGHVALVLKSGEVWVFRHQGEVRLALEDSVYLDESRPAPRPCKQIVLSGSVIEYAGQISWSFAKVEAPANGADPGAPAHRT